MNKNKKTGIATFDKRRYQREYHAHARGQVSYKSLAEDAGILCAVAAGEVTEAAAAAVLGTDIVGVREKLGQLAGLGAARVNGVLKDAADRTRLHLEHLAALNGQGTPPQEATP